MSKTSARSDPQFVMLEDGSIVESEPVSVSPIKIADQSLSKRQISYALSTDPAKAIKRQVAEKSSANAISSPTDAPGTQKPSSETLQIYPNPSTTQTSVVRADVCQLASNKPCEDSHFVVRIGNVGTLFGVVDGHGGSACAHYITSKFPAFFSHRLLPIITSTASGDVHSNELIVDAIKDAFEAFDNQILDLPRAALPSIDTMSVRDMDRIRAIDSHRILAMISPALNGACLAITLVLDDSRAFIANTGDCSVLIGRKKDDDSPAEIMHINPLHTANNRDERKYLQSMHPGEEDIVVCKPIWSRSLRVLGSLEPTRAFGDAFYKWPINLQHKINRVLLRFPHYARASGMMPECRTPPYVRATPSVRIVHLNPSDQYLVLTTDGIFEQINQSKISDIIVDFMHNVAVPSKLNASKYPIRHANAATHLIRQALRRGLVRSNHSLDTDFKAILRDKEYQKRYLHPHRRRPFNTRFRRQFIRSGTKPITTTDTDTNPKNISKPLHLYGDRGDRVAMHLIQATGHASPRHARDDMTAIVVALTPCTDAMIRTWSLIKNLRRTRGSSSKGLAVPWRQ